MSLDIHKYDNVRFHKNDLTHKRIKVLLLWFEHKVHEKDLTLEGQIYLMERWMGKLLSEELYEVLPFFETMKNDMINKLDNPEDDIVTYPEEVEVTEEVIVTVEEQKESFLRRIQHKIRKMYRLIIKRK